MIFEPDCRALAEPMTVADRRLLAAVRLEAIGLLTGDSVPGAELTVSDGVWRPVPAQHTYLWFRDGQPIAGEASADYRVRPDDVDHEISARVRVSAPGYAASIANTPALRIVPGDPDPDPDPGPGAQQPDPAPAPGGPVADHDETDTADDAIEAGVEG